MDHRSYSLDLALPEFWLFGCIRERLTSNPDAESLIKQITNMQPYAIKDNNKKYNSWQCLSGYSTTTIQ